MKTIELSQGYVTEVDDKNFERLNGFNWWAQEDNRVGSVYAVRSITLPNGKQTGQKMHRFIMGISNPKVKVDHKDHDGLNNQEYNLRVATYGDNNHNQRLRKDNTSGYKGVTWNKRAQKWTVQIASNGTLVYLGCFPKDKILDARDAYDAAALKYFGAFAFTNAMMEQIKQ